MDLFYYFTVVFLSVKAQSSLAHHTRYFVTGRNLAAAAATRQNPRRLISVSSPLSLFSVPLLPWSSFPGLLAATTGRAAAPFVKSSPTPLPASSIHQVCPPLLFPSAVRNGAPQTLTKLFCIRICPSCNILPNKFDFICKNYRVHMCTPTSCAGSAPSM